MVAGVVQRPIVGLPASGYLDVYSTQPIIRKKNIQDYQTFQISIPVAE
jgi:hypothetical protein